ncbi:hypothetical protein NXS19_001390 [Fusarium pseudograminearum]|nr:hypothetical protein NXS19_001390 [Fusarium pseudograminearum]
MLLGLGQVLPEEPKVKPLTTGFEGAQGSFTSYIIVRTHLNPHRSHPCSDRRDIMTIFALIIINKAGGLVYNKNFHEGLKQISTNDYLVLAGTFHGVHAITSRLNPVNNIPEATPPGSRPEPPSGLEVLETENFRMQCFTTMTGTKFLLFTDTTQANVDVTIRKIYDLYSDYVMKNPFYSLEMPVRCDIFDRKLLSYIREINNR